MDNLVNNKPDDTNGSDQLPMYSFFIGLKQNGFLVTPKQIADSNRIISQFSGTVNNEAELCNFLSPLFAQNEDEQKQFKEIFDTHFFNKKDPAPSNVNKVNIILHLRKKWKLYASVFTATLIILLAVYFINRKPVLTSRVSVFLFNPNHDQTNDNTGAYRLKTNERIVLQPQMDSRLTDSIKDVRLNTTFDWGDRSSKPDTIPSHTYSAEGIYHIIAYSEVIYKDHYQYTDTVYASVKVCTYNNQLAIEKSLATDSLTPGQKIKLKAVLTGKKPDRIIWSKTEGSSVTANEWETSFEAPGIQTIFCTAVYDSIGAPCTIQSRIELFVYQPGKPIVLNADAGESKPIHAEYRIKPSLLIITGGPVLLSFLLSLLFTRFVARAKKNFQSKNNAAAQKYNELLSSFPGKKPPFELPFLNKNYLTASQPAINELAWHMRKRIEDEATSLNIPKTISKTIINGGLFQPVLVPATLQSEYLVLIDDTHRNDQLVKLFEYLIANLGRQNVHIEKFYYRENLETCFSSADSSMTSFEKLSEKYSRYVLLVFGNAYQLLFRYYPIFDYENIDLLNRWRYKAVLTPVSFVDWSSKEIRGLLPAIPVFPVDSEGLLLFIQTIFNEDQNIVASLYKKEKSFYKVEKIDFENIEELETYCAEAGWANIQANGTKTNIFFQWIAALAVYPKIRWEITLAIGKAILDKYGEGEELNYTNLLRLARIKWMREGQFPDYTRLDLLKKLSRTNEAIARETVLSLLNEIPETGSVLRKSFAYEEKKIQEVVNETNLYAYDPIKYAAYDRSVDVFKHLWENKKIPDSPAKVYFRNNNKEWNTLFSSSEEPGQPLGVDKYLGSDNGKESPINKFYQGAAIICSLVFVVSLAAFLILSGLNFFTRNSIGGLTYAVSNKQLIRFTYLNKTSNASYDNGTLLIDTARTSLQNNQQKTISLAVNDSSRQISFIANNVDVYDTVMPLNREAYTISLNELQTQAPRRVAVKIILFKDCAGRFSQYKNLLLAKDSNLVITDSILQGTNNQRNAICVNAISAGQNVNAEKINSVIKGIDGVQINDKPAYPVNNDEIIVYYNAGPIISKPIVYLQYNNKANSRQVQQLQACLNSANFAVPGIEYQSNFSRNEVRFYSNSTKDSIAYLQNCLKKIYPGKTFYPVQVAMRHSDARAEIWIYDSLLPPVVTPSVTIQISDESLRASATRFAEELGGRGYKVSAIQTENYNYNSEISYYDKSMEVEAEKLKQFYRKSYPDLPIQSQLRNNNGQNYEQRNLSNTIVIWIRKLKEPDIKTKLDSITTKQYNPPVNYNNAENRKDSTSTNEIVNVASKEIGNGEESIGSNKTRYGQWFGVDGVPWSGIFVSWVYHQAKKTLPYIDAKQPGFASCSEALNYFQKYGWVTKTPQPGDIVMFTANSEYQTAASSFFFFNNGEQEYNAGIFVRWVNEGSGIFETIEANVSSRDRKRTDRAIVVRRQRNKSSAGTYFIHVK